MKFNLNKKEKDLLNDFIKLQIPASYKSGENYNFYQYVDFLQQECYLLLKKANLSDYELETLLSDNDIYKKIKFSDYDIKEIYFHKIACEILEMLKNKVKNH